MKLVDMKVQDYLQLVASDAPAPGGGSASALCGAQGIGLIAMVAKLTAGKEKFSQYRPVCEAVAAEANGLYAKLCAQIDTDTDAYGRIAAAFKLPKENEEQKISRKQSIADATRYAAEVPLDTMRLGLKGLQCAANLIGNYNTSCASDVGCAVYGMLSCVRGAWLNVMINISGLPDAEILRTEGEKLMESAEVLAQNIDKQVKADI